VKIPFVTLMVSAAMLVAQAAELPMPRLLFGVQVEPSAARNGVVVTAVKPGSPANAAGVTVGDVLQSINGVAVTSREDVLKALSKAEDGKGIDIKLLKEGTRSQDVKADLTNRKEKTRPRWEANALGLFSYAEPASVPQKILADMSVQRQIILQQLTKLKEDFEPAVVTAALKSICNLAKDANPQKTKEWNSEEAGEVFMRFKDEKRILELCGDVAGKNLRLTAYADLKCEVAEGMWPLNTPDERKGVPEGVIERLKILSR